jgi:hypothetical protein
LEVIECRDDGSGGTGASELWRENAKVCHWHILFKNASKRHHALTSDGISSQYTLFTCYGLGCAFLFAIFFLAFQFQESWGIPFKFLKKKEFLSIFLFFKGAFPGIPVCRNRKKEFFFYSMVRR